MCCASPLRTDQIQRSSSPLISQNCLSQIVLCNFPVSKHACRCGILTKKNVLFSLKFPYSAAFLFSWESLAETPFCFFCLISAASHQRLDALVLESGGIGRGQLRRWAVAAFPKCNTYLVASRMSANHLRVLERGMYVRRKSALPLNTVAIV